MSLEDKLVNGYTLMRKLGEGGMAEVWYAENRIKKKAAVKILKEEFKKMKPVIDRFENEAIIMVQLVHPNIRQVYDYATIDERPCIIMEYLEGADLSTRLKRGETFNSDLFKSWWNQLATALNYTHHKEVIHRDIKPSNIFLCDDGQVKLLDFGIAKIRSSITMTQTGSRMGTLMYMSPEQVKDSKNLDYRTDLYSLAVSFVHLHTGQAPYDSTKSSEFDIQLKIVREALHIEQIPDEWQNFLMPYLSKEPLQRPPLLPFENRKVLQHNETVSQPKSQTETESTIVDFSTQPQPKPQIVQPKSEPAKENTYSSQQKEPGNNTLTDNIEGYGKTPSPLKIGDTTQKKKNKALLLWLIGIAVVFSIILIVVYAYYNKEQGSNYRETTAGINIDMVFIKGGSFDMGCTPENDSECGKEEYPRHNVKLSSFYLAKTEVTNAQYCIFLNEKGNQYEGGAEWLNLNGSWHDEKCRIYEKDDRYYVQTGYEDYPVIYVSWYGAKAFCEWLGEKTGKNYRLPTEAQWEYAARSRGKDYKFAWGNGEPTRKKGGNLADDSFKKQYANWYTWDSYSDDYVYTAPVNSFGVNDIGLADMTGNVWEWCSDWYSSDYYYSSPTKNPENTSETSKRNVRGGSWQNSPKELHCSFRTGINPDQSNRMIGFRISRSN